MIQAAIVFGQLSNWVVFAGDVRTAAGAHSDDWNALGQIDGYGPRGFVFLATCALLSVLCLLAGLPAWICAAMLLAGPVVPAFYSLLVYKRLERRGNLET